MPYLCIEPKHKNMKYEIELPFFAGFYESILNNCETALNAIKDEIDDIYATYGIETSTDDFSFDSESRENDIIESFIKEFYDNSPAFVLGVTFKSLHSPNYYNFETDKIYAEVDLSEDWKEQVGTFIKDNYEWVKAKVKKDWSSRDGFVSFMSNDIDEWMDNLDDERYVSSIIGYIMLKEDSHIAEYLNCSSLDDIYDGHYVSYNDNVKDLINACVKKREADKLQLKIDFKD